MPPDDDEFLSSETLEKVHIEVIEHMKRAGTFDEIHVKLMNPLQNDERYLEIVRRFETECEKFCRGEDLTRPRNYLRAKLTDRFNKSRDDQLQLDAYVKRYLRSQDNDLRQIYNQHAEEFLRKFIPPEEVPVERSPTPPQASPPTPPQARISPIKDSTPPRRTPSPQTRSEDMEIDSEDEIEKPVFSPIGMGSTPSPKTDLRTEETTIKENNLKKEDTISQECDNNDVTPPNDHHQNNHHDIMETDDRNELNNTNHDRNNADDAPTPVCDGDDDDDANLDLDLDDVSSVKTADLANFDDLIEISDDEADLLNVEKKAKIPVKTLAGDIEDLKQTHTTTITTTVSNIVDPSDVPIPPMDPPPVSDSSDSNNLSRTTRNRKSNPRYNNEDFRLL